MRDVPEALVARVESGAATMCHAWIVELADETRLGFTDHDEELEVAGVLCRAGCGWTAGAGHQEVGEPGLSAASAVLDVDGPTEADIDQGRWDGARVEHWRVDWAEPELRVRLAVGTIRRLVRRGDQVIAEMEGPMAALDRVVGRTFSRLCDAVLGDGRCGVDLGAHPGATCDNRFGTCRDVFANASNFRGFPDMPGDDFVLARPMAGGRHDGGSRR